MSRGSFYRGTTIEQDGRFKNKEKLILDQQKFPIEYEIKIDINKVLFQFNLLQVELKAIKQWVDKRLNDILGFDDEFLSNYVISLLEDKDQIQDPRKIQVLMTGM